MVATSVPGLAYAQEEAQANVSGESSSVETGEPAEATQVSETSTEESISSSEELDKAEPAPGAGNGGTQESSSSGDTAFGDERVPLHSQLQVSTDSVSGALVYTYPLVIPPGRNGVQPNLTLSYNSQSSDNSSLFGYGWSLNIPFIERLPKTGIEHLYDGSDEYFYSSLSGELATTTVNTEYEPRVENGDFF